MNDAATLHALHAANRTSPDAHVERQMLDLRARLFARTTAGQMSAQIEAVSPAVELPAVLADRLDPAVLRNAIASNGALHVRGFLDARRVETLRFATDAAHTAQEASHAGQPREVTTPWFDPFDRLEGGGYTRGFVRGTGGVLAADSPRGLFQLLDTYYQLGVDRLVTEFLGERPALSAEKTTLRKVFPEPGPAGWHQDGQFLGKDIRSLNIWIALSDCGVDSPGLELVARRLDHIVQTGTDGTFLDWVASDAAVEARFSGAIVRPLFAAGDALLFDHLLLHRTHRNGEMTRPRYAIESWFFAPSAYPAQQTGIYI
jgi:hypothetical protein